MAKKREKLFSKVMMLIFLVLIVLGFSIPGFLNSGAEQNNERSVPKRVCQSDANCYLICDSLPVASLCLQNLCQQNACDEFILYPIVESPVSFQLKVEINGKKLNLENRTRPDDFLITFDDNKVEAFSEGLSLEQILGRSQVILTNDCLLVDDASYCETSSESINISVNGNETLYGGSYAVQEGDLIEISYEELQTNETINSSESSGGVYPPVFVLK